MFFAREYGFELQTSRYWRTTVSRPGRWGLLDRQGRIRYYLGSPKPNGRMGLLRPAPAECGVGRKPLSKVPFSLTATKKARLLLPRGLSRSKAGRRPRAALRPALPDILPGSCNTLYTAYVHRLGMRGAWNLDFEFSVKLPLLLEDRLKWDLEAD